MRQTVPVFCDNCALLALAQLDGAPLCAGCLLAQVERVGGGDAIKKIGPLDCQGASRAVLGGGIRRALSSSGHGAAFVEPF